MFSTVSVSNNSSRKKLADCNLGMSYHERLIKSNAIDLKGNHNIVPYNNGYSRIVPINKDKKIK